MLIGVYIVLIGVYIMLIGAYIMLIGAYIMLIGTYIMLIGAYIIQNNNVQFLSASYSIAGFLFGKKKQPKPVFDVCLPHADGDDCSKGVGGSGGAEESRSPCSLPPTRTTDGNLAAGNVHCVAMEDYGMWRSVTWDGFRKKWHFLPRSI